MRDKAFRRFQEKKKKSWAKRLLTLFFADIPDYIISDKDIGRRATTPQPCSCEMCGNPRHHFKSKKDKLTLQEQKEFEKFEFHDDTFIDDI